ncbi:MAG: LPS translocon maturation chaperone LptM [Thiothrix sp.]
MKCLLSYALALALLAGCGNKGPLYSPDNAQPNSPAKQASGK